MKSLINDKYLEEEYRKNLEKIPAFLRLTKVSVIIAGAVLLLGIITTFVLVKVVLPQDSTAAIDGIFDFFSGMTIITVGLILSFGLVGIWFLISLILQQSAYRKASDKARQLSELEDQHFRMKTKKEMMEAYKPAETATEEPELCPECGMMRMGDEKTCPCCGSPFEDKKSNYPKLR